DAVALRDDGVLAHLDLFDVAVWDATGHKIAALHDDDGALGDAPYYAGLAWSPDGAHLAVITPTDVLLWRIDQPAPERSLRRVHRGDRYTDGLHALAWSGDGTRLAIGSHAGDLFEYDVASLRRLVR